MNKDKAEEEAKRRYPVNPIGTASIVDIHAENKQSYFIEGALWQSQQGAVWVRVDYNNLPESKTLPYFVKMKDGSNGTLWPGTFKKWNVTYYLDESSKGAEEGEKLYTEQQIRDTWEASEAFIEYTERGKPFAPDLETYIKELKSNL